jgi:glycosyltransferase involved in cell wall biosynthesis
MNILLINDYLEGGGAEAVFRDQSEILKNDYNVDLFYAFKQFSDRKISPLSYIYSRKFKRKLELFLENRRFDIIIIHNYNSALSPSVLDALREYKRKINCKIIHYAHDFHLVCPNRGYFYIQNRKTINFVLPPTLFSFITKRLDYKSKIHSLLKKLQWIRAYSIGKKQKVFDLILTPSDFLAHHIRLLYPNANVKRMYNSCNSLDIKKKNLPKEKRNTIRMVYFGRLAKEKGLTNFIEALRLSEIDYTFTIIGNGDEKTVIKNLIEKYRLQDKISLKPSMIHHDLFEELQNYDVFVLPSLWYENAPLSIIEAASIGLGLFLAHHGGVLEMGKICRVSHFFDPSQPEDIVSQLQVLYRDFLAGLLPKADEKQLQSLFSEETYIKNLKKYFA